MIDPTTITNYNLNKYQLQEMAIFWVLVAGKTARTTARLLDNMLKRLHAEYEIDNLRPFDVIRMYDEDNPGSLETLLKSCGFGCQKAKARGIRELISKRIDLKTCTVKDLEGIHCIGPKTARCFIMHTRPNARHAGLDTHVLKWLKSLGYKVPASTPKGKVYTELENIFLALCDSLNMGAAELDLAIWNAYSTGSEYKIDTTSIKLPKQEN
jgi:thermostable 8-oxoguanine DNA glycosylase